MLELLRRWRVLLAILAFLILAGLIYLTGERSSVTPVEAVLRDAVAPVQGVLTRLGFQVRDTWTGLTSWRRLAQENRRLQELADQLRMENNELMQYKSENAVLREALGFAQASSHHLLAAEVIGRSPSNWYSTVILNRGSRDGVKPRMPVITAKGIVGQVRTVTARTATVLLVVDPKSAVGAMVRRTREPVLVEGSAQNPGRCTVRPLVREPDLKRGDRIVTSGLSKVFPEGLQVGYIEEVDTGYYGLSSTGLLTPWVDFSRLEYVFIVADDTAGVDENGPGVDDRTTADRNAGGGQ